MSDPGIGVVLMALGGPANLEEVEPYLRDMRRGRETPAKLVEEFRERYRRIGGKTPLLEISQAQAEGLQHRLAELGLVVRSAVGMRHSSPRIDDALRSLADAGVREIVGLCLTPYFSSWSVGGYQASLRDAAGVLGVPIRIRPIERWNREDGLIRFFVDAVRRGVRKLDAQGVPDPTVLFTAHSLPGIQHPEVDPYVVQLQETRRLIEEALPPMRTRFAYQSVGRREGPWLGPPAETTIEELGRDGARGVLVVPFGFVSDNLEILYDVDIEFREIGERHGLAFERTDSPNAHPDLVDALAHATQTCLGP